MTDPAKNDDISSSSSTTKPTPSKSTKEAESKATSPSVVTNYVGGESSLPFLIADLC